MAGDYLYNVFNPQWSSSATTTNTVYTTGINSVPTIVPAGWSEPTMTKAKKDPLEWLRGQVDEYVELGTLRD
jgi:hypothetical protein